MVMCWLDWSWREKEMGEEVLKKHQRELLLFERKESKPKERTPMEEREEKWIIGSERKRRSGQ